MSTDQPAARKHLVYDAATFPAPGSLVFIDRVKPYCTLCYTFGANDLWYDGDGRPVELLPELLLHTIYRERMIAARSSLQLQARKESDAAGERQAAAKALRQAADAEIEMAQALEMTLCRSEESPFERRLNHATRVRIDFYRASAQRLRVRADAVEQGE